MSKKDNRDYVYLVWKKPKTRRNHIVGQLSKNCGACQCGCARPQNIVGEKPIG